MPWRKSLCRFLTKPISDALMQLSHSEASLMTEIRVRTGRCVCWAFSAGVRETGVPVTQKSVDELVSALCGYSRYAYEVQIAQGYIALPGGHRAGVSGRAVYEQGTIVRMSAIHSVCIRIARHIDGAAISFRRYLFLDGRPGRLLLLGAPGCGKTTALRDAALYLAEECHLQVAAADEREELFAGQDGEAIDVITGAKKADALSMLLRSMAPQVLVTDEIGRMEDASALLDAVSCGVGVLASAHADGMEDVMRRPALRLLYDHRAFDRYVLLEKGYGCIGVWDADGKKLMEGTNGKLGNGADGADDDQRGRLSAGRWGKETAEMGAGDAALPASLQRRSPI